MLKPLIHEHYELKACLDSEAREVYELLRPYAFVNKGPNGEHSFGSAILDLSQIGMRVDMNYFHSQGLKVNISFPPGHRKEVDQVRELLGGYKLERIE